MARAMFFNLSGSGHVNPTLGLVAELVRRGETIVYYADEAYRAPISATGAEFRPLPAVEGLVWDIQGIQHLALLKLQQSWGLMPDLMQVVGRERPDYILFDSMGALGWLLSRKYQIPAVSSVSTFAFTPDVLQALALAELLGQPPGGQSEPSEIELRYAALSAEIGQAFGLQVPDWLRSLCMLGDLSLVYTSAAMQPAAARLDSSFRLVGPCLRPSETMPDFPYSVLEAENLIYISLGTVFNDNLAFYRQCLAAFSGSPYTVLLSIGQTVERAALGDVPANIVVTRFAPQLEVLKHTRLFVTHAGMNSVHEALYYGVPLVLVPQMGEQAIVAGQAVANGAGLRLEPRGITPEQLRQAADRVLADPAFRQNAEWLRDTLREAGGAPRAAEEILGWRQKLGERRLQRQPDGALKPAWSQPG